MNKKKVSVSGIDVYAECPRKYMFQYVYRRYRPSNEHFVFGTLGHKILELLSKGIEDDVIYTTIDVEQDRRSVQETLNTLKISNLKALVTDYIKIYREFLNDFTVIDTEVLLENKDCKGVIDLLAVNESENKLVIIDNKFTGKAKTQDDILNNLQLYMYANLLDTYPGIKKILKKYNIKKICLGYFSLSKIEIGPPKVLASGKLSKAINKSVTYDSFLKAIEDNNLDKSEYLDHLNKLLNNNESIVRYVEVKLTKHDFEDKMYEIESWTKLINYSIKNHLFPGRNAFHCEKGGFMGKKCDIYNQCKNHLGEE